MLIYQSGVRAQWHPNSYVPDSLPDRASVARHPFKLKTLICVNHENLRHLRAI